MLVPSFSQPSPMRHSFSTVPQADIQRSTFKRPFAHTTTFDAGYLVPIIVDEILPGDTLNLNMAQVTRLTTPLFPVMDSIFLDYFFFFCPSRLLWENFERFHGAQDDPGDSIDYLIPQVTCPSGGYTENSIADYFGLPIGKDDADVNALPFRMYNLVWNSFFRDENLQDSITVNIDDGPDAYTDYVMQRRGKRHDYFTSCLPNPIKDDASIALPLGDEAPVIGDGYAISVTDGSQNMGLMTYGASYAYIGAATEVRDDAVGTNESGVSGFSSGQKALGLSTSVDTHLIADLSSATASTINSLREAFQLQRMLERDARGGTRYVELLQSHFGVTSPDFRLQRPEYLGGGTSSVIVEAIPTTTDYGTDLGKLGGHGYSQGSGIGFTKSFVEHGYILGLVSARAPLRYQQGIERMWSKQTRYDFYYPSLAHLGEQEVLNKEIFYNDDSNDDLVFGYQERWSEYRYKPSRITGQMRSDAASPLDAWHLAEDFASLPVLNASFITEDPPIDRIQAVSETHFKSDMYFTLIHTRPMPTRSIPGLIDHF